MPRPKRLRVSAINTGSMLVSDVAQRLASFALYASVARALGIDDLGRLALGIAVLQVLTQLAGLGIRPVLVRDVAAQPSDAGRLTAAGLLATTGASLVAYAGLEAFLAFANYDEATVAVVRVIGLSLPFSVAVEVFHGVILGWERAHLIASGTVVVSVVFGVGAVAAVIAGASVLEAAWLVAGRSLLLALIQGRSVTRHSGGLARVGVRATIGLVRRALPFLGVNAANTARSNTVPLVLSVALDATAVGVFSAAHQLVVPVNLAAQAVAQAVYPVMARRWALTTSLRDVTTQSASVMAALVVPAAAGLAALAPQLSDFVFGEEQASLIGLVVRVLAIVTISRGITGVIGQAMWASGRVQESLAIALRNLALLVVTTVFAVEFWGVVGAAAAVAFTAIVNYVEHVRLARPAIERFPLITVIWRAAAASAMMVIVLFVLPSAPVLLLVAVGVAVYSIGLEIVYRLGGGSILDWVMVR